MGTLVHLYIDDDILDDIGEDELTGYIENALASCALWKRDHGVDTIQGDPLRAGLSAEVTLIEED